jgi:hypothetical protein
MLLSKRRYLKAFSSLHNHQWVQRAYQPLQEHNRHHKALRAAYRTHQVVAVVKWA